ncbi:heme A synthase [Amaricoccus solimangrovi]|uniref:Heme A synthase n=1 Tax=Amaricoccus solimangrovi TaxID=2589815 RepID=A0A501WKR9_9RHOB|nr:heme A synthase [Amaricoccus solimangrovi]TPE49372.1 heme A synthase [Amaricoccus solimangrovi]
MKKTRSIFEEVGAETPAEAPRPAPAPARSRPRHARGAIAVWLSILFVLVALMIAVGGLTRLTDSGLSITEWKPVTGALPPMDEAAWTAEFDKYKATPQAEIVNPEMTLAAFKSIYWWEWGHRQLGRTIGLVWAVGFLWFLVRRRIPPGWTPRLLFVGLLGGIQGAVGWWMVASGLTGAMTSVASYRLAIHLGIAFVILGTLTWYILALRRTESELLQARRQRSGPMMRWGTALVCLAFLQVILGALVAGIDAGRNFPEWPLMAGQIAPPGMFDLEPLWRNFLENPATTQFIHRCVGYLVLILALVAWLRARRSALASIRKAYAAPFHMGLLQVALGVATVLTAAQPHVAITHQIGAIALFALIVRARFTALYPAAQKIARA